MGLAPIGQSSVDTSIPKRPGELVLSSFVFLDTTPNMKKIRCAIYTRKSAEEGLEQAFNSLDAQREACAAYVARVLSS